METLGPILNTVCRCAVLLLNGEGLKRSETQLRSAKRNKLCGRFTGDVASLQGRKMTLAPGAYLKRVGLK